MGPFPLQGTRSGIPPILYVQPHTTGYLLLTLMQGITGAGGSNWVDVDTTIYNKSLILTYNYAYSGATIDAALVTPYIPIVASLKDQVGDFLATAAAKPASTPWTSENALFSIWIGINDIGNSYYWTNGSRSAFSELLLDTEFALVEKLVSSLALYRDDDSFPCSSAHITLADCNISCSFC